MAKSKLKAKSKAKSKPVTVAGLKRAIEGRKASALAGLYADDAVVLVVDRAIRRVGHAPRRQKRHHFLF